MLNFFSTEILKLKFEGNDAACSDVKLRIFLDGKLIEETDFIIRAKEIDLSPVSSGNHTLKLSPVGRLGGCNTGTLGAWGGKLTLYVSI